jgi:hypothetical protein
MEVLAIFAGKEKIAGPCKVFKDFYTCFFQKPGGFGKALL